MCRNNSECQSDCCVTNSLNPQKFCTSQTVFLECVPWRKKTQNATATVASGLAATQTGSAHQRPSSCSVYLGASPKEPYANTTLNAGTCAASH
uniref:Leucine rich colipase-like 1 n=1 Tax=Mus musculus TaxID=10090 RepID=A0A087WQC1_MOUSE